MGVLPAVLHLGPRLSCWKIRRKAQSLVDAKSHALLREGTSAGASSQRQCQGLAGSLGGTWIGRTPGDFFLGVAGVGDFVNTKAKDKTLRRARTEELDSRELRAAPRVPFAVTTFVRARSSNPFELEKSAVILISIKRPFITQ